MNKIFKVVWNHATQTFTVVSELAKHRGKVSSQTDERGELSTSRSSSGQISGVRGLTLTAISSFFILSTFSHNVNAAIAIGTNSGIYAATGDGATSTSVSKGTTSTNVYAYNYYNPGSKSYSNRLAVEGTGNTFSDVNWSEGIAIGRYTNAVSQTGVASSVAIGDYANTSGALSVAIGPMAQTGNIGSVAIGTASLAYGFNSLAIMRQSAATSDFAMAMGSAAWADGRSSVAMGSSATAKGKQSFALGSADHVNLAGDPGNETLRTKYDGMNNTQSNGDRSFAIGTSAKTNGNDSFALGSDAQTGTFKTERDSFLNADVLNPDVAAQSSFAMGTKARASQERAFALGTTTNATGVDAFALGTNATANQTRSIAFGTNTTSTGVDSFALGTEADARANNTVALGTNATSTKDNAFALGTNASATNLYALALGGEAKAFGNVSVAIGGAAHATQENSMAIGREARSYGNNSIAMGSFANVASERSISIGTSSVVRTDKTVAIGSEALVDQNASGSVAIGETSKVVKGAENSTTIGFNSTVSAKNASAIGAKAVASHENAVALGSNSVTRNATQETTATVNGITYGGFSGTNPSSVVSVGNVGAERQIVNVAAGKISSDSTDAINGSQLYATNNIIGNVASSIVNNLGGNAKVDGNGNITFNDIGGTGKETIHDAVLAAKTEVKAGTNTRVDTSTASDGHTVYTVHANNTKVTQGDGISVTSTTNAQNETSYTVALNEETKKQLKKEESASAGNSNVNVTLNSSVNDTGGKDYIVTLNNTLNLTDAGSVTIGGTTINNDGLKITNGPNITSSGIDAGDKKITNVTAGDVSVNSKDAVNGSQLYATNQNVTTIRNEVAKGWNITTSGNTNKSDVNQVAMGDTVTFDGGSNIYITQDGKKISIATSMTPTFTNVTTGNTVMNNDGLTIKGGPNVTTSGIDAGNKVITNVADGKISSDSKEAVNGSQLYSVKTVADSALQSFTTSVNGQNVETINKDNNDVGFVNGKGTTARNDSNNITFDINTTSLTADDKGNVTAGDTTGDTFVKAGDIAVAINKAAAAAKTEVEAGSNIEVASKTGANGQTIYNVSTSANPTFTSVTTGDSVLNDSGLTITGGPSITKDGVNAGNKKITNVTEGNVSADSKDAVNGSQLYATNQNVTNITNEVAKGWNITTSGNTTTPATEAKVEMGNTVTIDGGNNILLTQDGKKISIATSMTPTFTNVTTGNTVMNNDGVTITGGSKDTVSLGKDGLNNGNNTITNVAPGVNGTDAVNKDQLEAVNSTASAGWNLTVNGTNSSNVAPNATVDLANTDGNIVITKDANNVTFALNNNLTIGGKDGKDGQIGVSGKDGKDGVVINGNGTIIAGRDGVDGVDGQIGATGKDGASVVLNGKDGSIGLTGPKGTDGKDGVSANISVKDGAKGLDGNDGKDGESKTRIVYEKADGTTEETEEVATLNDGLIFTGNNEVKNNHKLNSVVKVVGEGVDKAASENFSSASGNINVKANGSDTLEIQLNKDVNLTKDGSVTVGNTVVNNEGVKVGDTSLTQDGLTIKDGPSITKDGIDAGDKKITNVAAGNVSVSSKDAVNGSQLYATNQNVTNNTNAINNVTTTVNKGWYVTTSGNTETSNVKSNVKMGDTVTIDGGKNIKVKQSGNTVSVATVDDPSFNSVTVGGNNGVNISSTEAKDGVKELSVGSTNAPTRVTNVAAGVRNTDAVNVGQLKGVVNNIDNKVNNMNKDLKAGIAGAMAAGNLYHATIPGKSMVAAGVGTYKGQAALSVGYSRLSDNGKTGVKVSFNTDSRGGVGAAASVGYQW